MGGVDLLINKSYGLKIVLRYGTKTYLKKGEKPEIDQTVNLNFHKTFELIK